MQEPNNSVAEYHRKQTHTITKDDGVSPQGARGSPISYAAKRQTMMSTVVLGVGFMVTFPLIDTLELK